MKNEFLYSIVTDILGDPKRKNDYKGQYSFDCPICSLEKGLIDGDGKGNFEINLTKEVFKCWSCSDTHNTHGSVFKFIKNFGNSKQLRQYKLINPFSIKLGDSEGEIKTYAPVHLPKEFIKFKDANKNNLIYKQAINYLRGRNISDEIIEKYDIGYVKDGEYKNRIIVPSFDKNKDVDYFIGRSFGKTKLKYKNPEFPKEEIIFNEYHLNWDSTIYLVEGVFDHIVVPNSIPMLGKHLTNNIFFNILKKSSAYIVILLDGDAWEDAIKIYNDLNIGKLNNRIRIIKLPTQWDISEINRLYGKKGVIKVLQKATKLL